MINRNIWLTAFLSFVAMGVMAHTSNPGKSAPKKEVSLRGFCANSESSIDQEINNVRARLLGGGDCWWNFNDGRYIVPKVDPSTGQKEVSSIFAASVWLGGVDGGGNLKLACQDYRPSGRNDFWPGPLDPITGKTTEQTCKDWDKHFRVTGDEIRQHLSNLAAGITDPNIVPRGVKGWPARGNPFFVDVHQFPLPNTSQGLAGFFDADGDGDYDPLKGDYPSIEIRGCGLDKYPAEMIFWIYNDEGSNSSHGRTGGKPIQMEVQVQAFGYQTSDELNDMTFQRYKLINRATDIIDSTFFAMWVDADLGCATDDYIGCDTANSLMYTYNQDAQDGQPGCNCDQQTPTYCNEVPILGVDYFRGPRKPIVIKDWQTGEDKDTLIEIGMSSFMYYNNPSYGTPLPPTTDPSLPNEFYNYLTGTWKDGTPLTYGNSGYNIGSTNFTKYALGDSPDDPTGWSMCTAGLDFGDRRTLQASGPFLLQPGATNELIIGVPWVANIDYPCPDIELLLRADKLAQGLFDNCFERLEGPDAPTVDWVELDKQLIAVLSNNSVVSNNVNETYAQIDFLAPDSIKRNTDPTIKAQAEYRFEGYKIFQVRNPNVSVRDFEDPDQSRLVYQVDKKNGISKIFNWIETADPQFPNDPKKKFYYPVEQVDGADAGIRHTFSVKEDQFATSNIRTLINHKKYYYAVVAYAYNNWGTFDQSGSQLAGQPTSYLEGGRVEIKTVIPRPIVDQVLNAAYGDGVEITRIEGQGAGGNFLDISDDMRNAMVQSGYNKEVTYLPGQGPLNISIFNPFEVKDGEYELNFFDSNNDDGILDADARWELRVKDSNGSYAVVDSSLVGINEINEQLFAQYGFSVSVAQTPETGDLTPSKQDATIDSPGSSNGAIGAQVSYSDPNKVWIAAQPDQETGVFNFLQTGTGQADFVLDPEQQLSGLGINGAFSAYALAQGELPTGPNNGFLSSRLLTPAWTGKISGVHYNNTALGSIDPSVANNRFEKLRALPNVDIVLTPDKSKWSRCIVIESASEYYTANMPGVVRDTALKTESGADRVRQSFDTRYALSVGKDDNNGDGLPDPDGAVEPATIPELDANGALKPNPRAGQPLRGMGWFPGYAVNVETGERLNIFFGENSCYQKSVSPTYTGRDMMFNPTDEYFSTTDFLGAEISNLVFGGQHFVYVANTPYDECEFLRYKFTPEFYATALKNLRKRDAIPQISWAGMLVALTGYQSTSLNEGLIPTETVFKMRVQNPYQIKENGTNGNPRYRFRINGRSSTALNTVQIENALDSIKVVPNPYFGFSQYEVGSLSNVVKITNAPAKCVVTIYSIDGKFIRQYKRDEIYSSYKQITPAIEWDMKNNKGIPVASGVYLINIAAEGMGDRTVKWFGVQRQFDPTGL